MKVLVGARPAVADALDRDSLLRAVDGLSADAVIHELTALREPPRRHGGMALTNRLRTEGTTNLLAAAEQLGAKRFLTQSIIFGYGFRDHGARLITEEYRSACRPGQAYNVVDGRPAPWQEVFTAMAETELGWRPRFPTYHEGVRAAATREVPWRSRGRSGAGTRSA